MGSEQVDGDNLDIVVRTVNVDPFGGLNQKLANGSIIGTLKQSTANGLTLAAKGVEY
jgi:hypothetical protein